MSQITTHILDLSRGKPAENVTVALFLQQGETWRQLGLNTSDENGRVADLLAAEAVVEPGIYRMRFETRPYFDQFGISSFYPFVEIHFTIAGAEHYHVPLLISPFGYSTYRGS